MSVSLWVPNSMEWASPWVRLEKFEFVATTRLQRAGATKELLWKLALTGKCGKGSLWDNWRLAYIMLKTKHIQTFTQSCYWWNTLNNTKHRTLADAKAIYMTILWQGNDLHTTGMFLCCEPDRTVWINFGVPLNLRLRQCVCRYPLSRIRFWSRQYAIL